MYVIIAFQIGEFECKADVDKLILIQLSTHDVECVDQLWSFEILGFFILKFLMGWKGMGDLKKRISAQAKQTF